MRSFLCLLVLVTLITIYCHYVTGHRIPENTDLTNNDLIEDLLSRQKRQLENFDDDYPTATGQGVEEEPSFWDRVVKVALKLFNRFMEWLNS